MSQTNQIPKSKSTAAKVTVMATTASTSVKPAFVTVGTRIASFDEVKNLLVDRPLRIKRFHRG